MAKQIKNTNNKKKTPTKSVKNNKVTKTTTKKTSVSNKRVGKYVIHKTNIKLTGLVVLLLGVFLIFSSYAWFSTTLNVKIRTFNMLVTRNSGLSISLDAINYDTFVEINYDTLVRDLTNRYRNHTNHWSRNGLTPVSSNGISNSDDMTFDMYHSSGVRYYQRDRNKGFIGTELFEETTPREFNYFIAFDLFFKNVTGSPVPDNLFIDYGTEITLNGEASEEMEGLVNSTRIGFVRVGSLPNGTDPIIIQNMQCNNGCRDIIYEPNSTKHTELSKERASKYNITLVDGEDFPTYACIKEGGPIFLSESVSGSSNINTEYFSLQETMTEADTNTPLFEIPDGITKVRVYLWIEGQDIDSLETNSDGAELNVSINFIKDTAGYDAFD